MKKLLLLTGISVLLILSCTMSVGMVFDDSVPEEQSTYISSSVGEIIGYNGISVKWKQGFKAVQIPAGDTLLEWNIDAPRYGSSARYTGKNLLMRYNFEPQKWYYFIYDIKNGAPGLNVYVYAAGEKVEAAVLNNWSVYDAHYVGFAPFLNVRRADEKLILE
jgi:hypothetical protein